MTIYDCRTHVRMTSMTSSVDRTDLNFEISVALLTALVAYDNEATEFLHLKSNYLSKQNKVCVFV